MSKIPPYKIHFKAWNQYERLHQVDLWELSGNRRRILLSQLSKTAFTLKRWKKAGTTKKN